MNILALIMIALVGTLVLSGPINSYGDSQLDTLLQIAKQAKENLSISLSQITIIPSDILQLYQQGSNETDSLSKAIDNQDAESAKKHFLSAMNLFNATNEKINSLNMTEPNEMLREQILQSQNDILKLESIGQRLKTIAITNHADFNFTQFDNLIEKAKHDLDDGNITDVSKSIQTANQIVTNAYQTLIEVAKQKATDRAKNFTEKQIQRLSNLDLNAAQTATTSTANSSSISSTIPSLPSEVNLKDMMTKLRELVAGGKFDEALKIIKSLRAYQQEQLIANESSSQNPSHPSTSIENSTKTSINSTTIIQPLPLAIANSTTNNPPSNVAKTNSTTTNPPSSFPTVSQPPFSSTLNDGIQINNGKSDSHTYGWGHAVSLVKFTGLTPGNSIDKVAINIFSAAGNIRYKVYQDDGVGGSASTLLAESNSIPTTIGTTYNLLITPAIIPSSGNVWAGFEPDNNKMDAYYSLTPTVAQEWNYHAFGSGPNPFVLSGDNQIEFWAGIHIVSSSSHLTIANSTTTNPPANVTVTNQVNSDLSHNTNSSETKNGIETTKTESKVIPQRNHDLSHQHKNNRD
jgi:uncharacterized protein YdaT